MDTVVPQRTQVAATPLRYVTDWQPQQAAEKMDRRAAYTREELEEIFDAENQQANLRYARPPHCSIGVESAELAHALAKRVLEERDEAIQRVAQLEAALQRSMGQAEKAMHERDEAAIEVVRGEHERDELEAELLLAHNLLADASYKNEALLRRVRQLEKWREVASQVLDSREVEPPPPPPASEADAALGLTRTKEAIVAAVKEAAKLPPDERKRKFKQLKLKWHPDKHEVLKEMAEEVFKLISACIEEHGGDSEEKPEQKTDA